MVTREEIEGALEQVHDPHVPVPIAKMGMLRGIDIAKDGSVKVELGIPCLGCPGVSMLRQSIKDAVLKLDGVSSVTIDEGWHHEWDTGMIAPEARAFMKQYGGIRT